VVNRSPSVCPVALLAIDTDTTAAKGLTIPLAGERYTLAEPSRDLQVKTVQLNGTILRLGAYDALPPLKGVAVSAGAISLAPATITFLALPRAENKACR
jgi:heparanase 1